MLPRRCNIIKASIRALCVVLGHLIMTSLPKLMTAPHIPSIKKLEQIDTDVYFYKLFK